MKLRDAFHPKMFRDTLIMVFRNFANWRFYKKQMKRLNADGSLKQNGMRLDKRNRAYYVLNLEPEILMMGEETIDLERSRVYESLGKKKPLFEKAGLGEIIEAKTDRIKDETYYAYLVQIKYRPIATIWNVIYCFVWLAALAVAAYFIVKGVMQYETIVTWFSNVMTAK